MDPIDLLILALRIALVALLYLFLVTVMRTATRSLRRGPSSVERRPAEQAVRVPPKPRNETLALLVLEAGGTGLRSGQVFELTDGAVLGRFERADLVLADSAVSSEHARVSRVGRAWVVADLGSTNGTRVNGSPVQGETVLAPGDVLGLGNVKLKVGARQAAALPHTGI